MRSAFVVAALFAALAVDPAAAGHRRLSGPDSDYGWAPYARSARMCQPLCQWDMTPCDPPEFKRADGRCTNPLSDGTSIR